MKAFFLILLFCCFACNNPSKIVVTNFDEVVTLTADGSSDSKQNIVRLQLRLRSNADRSMTIGLRASDEIMDEILINPGDNIERLVDWYSDRAEIVFIGAEGTKGSVEIEYMFSDI